MGARRTTFGKLERDRAKKAKAHAKRERREERRAAQDDVEHSGDQPREGERLGEGEALEQLGRLHERFDEGAISFADFEEQKAALLERLAVD